MTQSCAPKVSEPRPPGCLDLQSKIKILSLQNHTPIYTLNLETLGNPRHLAWWDRHGGLSHGVYFKHFRKSDAKLVVLGSQM